MHHRFGVTVWENIVIVAVIVFSQTASVHIESYLTMHSDYKKKKKKTHFTFHGQAHIYYVFPNLMDKYLTLHVSNRLSTAEPNSVRTIIWSRSNHSYQFTDHAFIYTIPLIDGYRTYVWFISVRMSNFGYFDNKCIIFIFKECAICAFIVHSSVGVLMTPHSQWVPILWHCQTRVNATCFVRDLPKRSKYETTEKIKVSYWFRRT